MSKVKIAQIIEWDDALPLEEQSYLAQAWFNQNVQDKITFYDDEKGKVKPTRDKFGRPEKWVIDLPECTVELKWNFQKKGSSDWTKAKDTVTLKMK